MNRIWEPLFSHFSQIHSPVVTKNINNPTTPTNPRTGLLQRKWWKTATTLVNVRDVLMYWWINHTCRYIFTLRSMYYIWWAIKILNKGDLNEWHSLYLLWMSIEVEPTYICVPMCYILRPYGHIWELFDIKLG